jgi:hypothetical protein
MRIAHTLRVILLLRAMFSVLTFICASVTRKNFNDKMQISVSMMQIVLQKDFSMRARMSMSRY